MFQLLYNKYHTSHPNVRLNQNSNLTKPVPLWLAYHTATHTGKQDVLTVILTAFSVASRITVSNLTDQNVFKILIIFFLFFNDFYMTNIPTTT